MRAARRIYEQMGFRRCAEFDLSASDMMGSTRTPSPTVDIIAYPAGSSSQPLCVGKAVQQVNRESVHEQAPQQATNSSNS